MTAYEDLGVAETATDAEITAAFRRKVREHHPDHGGSAAAFRCVVDAHEIIGDPESRAAYDASLRRDRAAAARQLDVAGAAAKFATVLEKGRPAIREVFGADAPKIERAGEVIGGILRVVELVDAHQKARRTKT